VRGPDGRPVTMTVVKLKSLAVGEHTMPDVEAGVVESGGSGVLGQSFLNRLARWKVDSAKKTLEFVP
jgi:predicted aspartyl protease